MKHLVNIKIQNKDIESNWSMVPNIDLTVNNILPPL